MDKHASKMKKNKPEYLYIKSNELGVHTDNEKTVKVIAGKYEKAKVLKKIIMLSQFIFMLF